MNTVQRIAKNTGIMLTSQVISYILAFLYMMYMARYLGVAAFGILSVAIAFMRIFSALSDLGLSTFMVREVARDKSLGAKYLANISLMKVILVSVTFGLIALTVNIMGYPSRTITVVYVVGLSVIFMGFTQVFYGFFRAFERMEYQGIGCYRFGIQPYYNEAEISPSIIKFRKQSSGIRLEFLEKDPKTILAACCRRYFRHDLFYDR